MNIKYEYTSTSIPLSIVPPEIIDLVTDHGTFALTTTIQGERRVPMEGIKLRIYWGALAEMVARNEAGVVPWLRAYEWAAHETTPVREDRV